ncbi:MAG: MAPEG family protein [Paracoccaceae bacterium]
MSVELWGLVGLAVLVLVYVGVQGLIIDLLGGIRWGTGPRDLPPPAHALIGRANRALRNLLETAPAFMALVLVAELSGRANVVTNTAVMVYLAARSLYLPLYLVGVPWLRSFAWNIATGAIVAVLVGIFIA